MVPDESLVVAPRRDLIRALVLERDDKLRPEMGTRVVFVEENAPVQKDDPKMLISRDAVVRRNGTTFVFVLEQETVRERPVQIGTERAGRVAVLDGLKPGEDIVVSPPSNLKNDDRVRREKQGK
jgi:multidrug efflux pump subunit AcrA (membrane-fusion protein)